MTEKRKHEAMSPIKFWWNEFLFVRHFAIETDLSPIEAAKCLRTLRNGDGCTVRFYDPWLIEEVIAFDIGLHEHKNDGNCIASAKGMIIDDDNTGTSTVSGHVRFDWQHCIILIMAICFLPIILMVSGESMFASVENIFYSMIWVFFGMGYWGYMHIVRNRLINAI